MHPVLISHKNVTFKRKLTDTIRAQLPLRARSYTRVKHGEFGFLWTVSQRWRRREVAEEQEQSLQGAWDVNQPYIAWGKEAVTRRGAGGQTWLPTLKELLSLAQSSLRLLRVNHWSQRVAARDRRLFSCVLGRHLHDVQLQTNGGLAAGQETVQWRLSGGSYRLTNVYACCA